MIKEGLAFISTLLMQLAGMEEVPNQLAIKTQHTTNTPVTSVLSASQSSAFIGTNQIKITSPAPREAWSDLAQDDPNTLVSQMPAWMDVMCAVGGYADASRYYELPGGQRFLLPMVSTGGLLQRLASPPAAWGFGGLLGSEPIRASDVALVLDDLAKLPAAQVMLRPNPLDAAVWKAGAPSTAIAIPRRAHIIDLKGGFNTVAKQFDKDARYNSRKAERNGVSVEYDNTDRLVPAFYELFMMSLERWAIRQHEPVWLARWRGQRRDSFNKFIQMSLGMKGACHWYVARVKGELAGAILVLRDKNAHYTRSVMNHELASTAANYLLLRTALEDACNAGCRWFHMGESGNSESLSNFKEHFGAKPYAYAEYRVERLPVTKVDTAARNVVKKLIGFKDA